MIQADLERMTYAMQVLKGGESMKAIKARLDELSQQFEALRGTEAFVAWEKVYNADGALAAPGAPLAVRENPTLPFDVPDTASGTEADAVKGELEKLGLMALVEKIKNTAEQGAATGIMAG
ncbi:hypothetical protein [Microvirga tunisiensis]|uniref:Uncharacterized protein n=1 Tax=Microvirga tunisiensis TaxID=2108360 RepID=A0A5N7MDE4_9HYPH|nr:hypothetical protein [Microvirga tunisiensis]MPR08163.1 hypothetical protein [Microvirga tunisiensis]MPR24124.1 hypothetical protein [Microvirga tunisiensis]